MFTKTEKERVTFILSKEECWRLHDLLKYHGVGSSLHYSSDHPLEIFSKRLYFNVKSCLGLSK